MTSPRADAADSWSSTVARCTTSSGGGPADPGVLALHGGGQTAYMFEELGKALRTTHHVIAPDLPGHGDSDSPLRRSSSSRHALAATVPPTAGRVRARPGGCHRCVARRHHRDHAGPQRPGPGRRDRAHRRRPPARGGRRPAHHRLHAQARVVRVARGGRGGDRGVRPASFRRANHQLEPQPAPATRRALDLEARLRAGAAPERIRRRTRTGARCSPVSTRTPRR